MSSIDHGQIRTLNDLVRQESAFVDRLTHEVGKVIVGQRTMLERIVMGLLCDGHVLLEGVPGLAKTLTIRTVAQALDLAFHRLQFTPDLLPADLIGTLIYRPQTGDFVVKRGPVFANIILADEINRAPAKVQSALLEAMQERQVTIGDDSHALPSPFLVLATQNPIEQEGTYPLPEAQVDRFMLKVKVTYPTMDEERMILERMAIGRPPEPEPVINLEDLQRVKGVVDQVYMDEEIRDYILRIVFATREPDSFGLKDLRPLIDFGASPRASIYLAKAARCHAFLRHRGFVAPEDVKAVGPDVLRHRIALTYEAEAEEVSSEAIIQRIFDQVEVQSSSRTR